MASAGRLANRHKRTSEGGRTEDSRKYHVPFDYRCRRAKLEPPIEPAAQRNRPARLDFRLSGCSACPDRAFPVAFPARNARLETSMTDRLTLLRHDDWHIHLRDGAVLTHTVADAARTFPPPIIIPHL